MNPANRPLLGNPTQEHFFRICRNMYDLSLAKNESIYDIEKRIYDKVNPYSQTEIEPIHYIKYYKGHAFDPGLVKLLITEISLLDYEERVYNICYLFDKNKNCFSTTFTPTDWSAVPILLHFSDELGHIMIINALSESESYNQFRLVLNQVNKPKMRSEKISLLQFMK